MAFIDTRTEELTNLIGNTCESLADFAISFDRLRGARLCLVGGAAWADKIHYGFFKEKYDIVVQLNHHILRRPSQPCHWWIARSGAPITVNDMKEKDRKPLLVSTAVNTHKFPDMVAWSATIGAAFIPFHETAHAKMNPFHYSLEWCNQFWNELDTNPFIGTLALRMILNYPIRSVFVTGFDFFQEPNGGFKRKVGPHVVIGQKDWFRRIWHTDFRVQYDQKLHDVLGLDFKARGLVRGTYEVPEV